MNQRSGNRALISWPLAYHITVRCYGTRLLGDEEGSVHHSENIFGSPMLPFKPGLRRHEENLMDQSLYEMDSERRQIVLESVKQTCTFRGWELYAVHVRSNHWHVVVQAM